jgi:periplasmic protein CpxP/Spy
MLMTTFVRSLAVTAVLVSPIAWAQSAAPLPQTAAPAGPSPAAAPPSGLPAPSAETRAAVDQRIRMLQTQLGITEAQMPLWSAFAQAMRDNAAATEALFTQRADAVATMNATENMHSYVQIARAYADDTERLATAFDSLYASLSETQKQAADTLFRLQSTAAAQPHARR